MMAVSSWLRSNVVVFIFRIRNSEKIPVLIILTNHRDTLGLCGVKEDKVKVLDVDVH